MERAAGRDTARVQPDGVPTELEEVRFHWGSAYDIGFECSRWIAQRRDGKGAPLTDPQPGGLREKIAADYLASPVPRDLP